jgi:hypothetical protein
MNLVFGSAAPVSWLVLASVPYMMVFKRNKSIWWMPRCVEAMKDVARCDKPREAVSKL